LKYSPEASARCGFSDILAQASGLCGLFHRPLRKAMAKKVNQSIYSVHPGVFMVQKWIAELPEKTGRSLDQWLTFINKHGPKAEAERRDWLKKDHKLRTNTAWWLAERSVGKGNDEETAEGYLAKAEQYVKEMFEKKPDLRPIYDEVLKIAFALGRDVKACPCKTMVPLYRTNVFAQLKPSTRSRLDLGFCLRGEPFTQRLIDTGGTAKKDRITHRVGLSSVKDIDGEVKRRLRQAYEMDG
jgi:hypothetical protein